MTPSHPTGTTTEQSEAPRGHEEHGSVPSTTAPALYALCLVLFVAGLWLFGYSMEVDRALLWWVAMALSTVAFLLPLQVRHGVGRSR